MKRAEEHALIAQGKNELFSRLKVELKHADDVGAIEQYIDAESVVDQYLLAIDEGSAAWPDRQDLAYACTHLLITTNTMKESDWNFVGKLNAPGIGISMMAIASQIADMKIRATAGLKQLAEAEDEISLKAIREPFTDYDIPF